MVHVIAFTNKFFVEFIFSTDKVFYNTIHPGRVLVITCDGFIRIIICDKIHKFWTVEPWSLSSCFFPIKDVNCPFDMIRGQMLELPHRSLIWRQIKYLQIEFTYIICVRSKIGNREKNRGNMGNAQRNWGEIGETWGNVRGHEGNM